MISNDINISTDKQLLDIPYIYNYLSNQSYWAKGRKLETIERCIANSICFGVYINGRQIAFARVTTDHATIAHLSDVFVDEAYRGQGVAVRLLRYIFDDPGLKDIYRWMLGTRDAHELYRKFGFSACAHPERIMERVRKPSDQFPQQDQLI